MEVSEGCQDVYFPSFLSARLQEVAAAIFLTKALVPTVGSSPRERDKDLCSSHHSLHLALQFQVGSGSPGCYTISCSFSLTLTMLLQ